MLLDSYAHIHMTDEQLCGRNQTRIFKGTWNESSTWLPFVIVCSDYFQRGPSPASTTRGWRGSSFARHPFLDFSFARRQKTSA